MNVGLEKKWRGLELIFPIVIQGTFVLDWRMKFSDTAVVSLMIRNLLGTSVLLQRHELR